MNRLRWIDIPDFTKEEFKVIRTMIDSRQLTPGRLSGFKIQSSTNKQIIARFVKRYDYVEKVQDPFGNVLDLPVFGFDEVDFCLYSSAPQIEILDASASSVSLLVGELVSFLSRETAVEDVQVKLLKWLKCLGSSIDGIVVKATMVVDIALTTSISAKVSLEGVEDVRDCLKKLIGSRKHSIQKIRLDGRFLGEDVRIDLYSHGRAHTFGNLEKLRVLLRDGLEQARTEDNPQ